MGGREMDRLLEQWQMDTKDLRRRMILAPTPRGSGAVVRHLAAGTGLDGNSDGGGAETGPTTQLAGGPPPSAREGLQP